MGRGVRVFHAPGQSPYSVLVEQRGVDQLLLLESQVKLTNLAKQGCLFPPNLQEQANEQLLFQAILTLSPAEAEPLKKTYVKLCDAYGILGNLRLNAGEVRFQSLFKV